MLKNISKLECKVGEKIYQFLCDSDSPIEHVKESLFQFQKYIGYVEDQQKALQEKLEQEKAKVSESESPSADEVKPE